MNESDFLWAWKRMVLVGLPVACVLELSGVNGRLNALLGVIVLSTFFVSLFYRRRNKMSWENEHWSSPNGCHPDCPACAAERGDNDESPLIIQVSAEQMIAALSRLDDYLRGNDGDEIDPLVGVRKSADILRELVPRRKFSVTVTAELLPDCSLTDADIDDEGAIGEHVYEIETYREEEAEQLALDRYHNTYAIGVLDYVDIEVKVG